MGCGGIRLHQDYESKPRYLFGEIGVGCCGAHFTAAQDEAPSLKVVGSNDPRTSTYSVLQPKNNESRIQTIGNESDFAWKRVAGKDHGLLRLTLLVATGCQLGAVQAVSFSHPMVSSVLYLRNRACSLGAVDRQGLPFMMFDIASF
jgi:hypothetical protein